MVLRWDEGRATIEKMLVDSDPDTAFTVAYDASRFALTAVLAVQGLRPKTDGGHLAVYEALLAQFPSMASRLRPFDRLRRTRNERQYPALGSTDVTRDDVEDDIDIAQDLIEFARPLIAEMPVF